VYVSICTHACMHSHTDIHTDIHTYRHTYRHTYIRTDMHACMHPYIHACMHICLCVCAGTRTGWLGRMVSLLTTLYSPSMANHIDLIIDETTLKCGAILKVSQIDGLYWGFRSQCLSLGRIVFPHVLVHICIHL
jgi:hypothetical protein